MRPVGVVTKQPASPICIAGKWGVPKDPFPGSSGEVIVVGVSDLHFRPVTHDSETGGTGWDWEKLGVSQRCRDCPSYPDDTLSCVGWQHLSCGNQGC